MKHYNLKSNPAAQVGNMGKAKGREMLFWTKAEYLKFADAMMDKPLSYYAFEMLYWCGIREGELLALTPGDFDFEKQTVSISKSYQRIKGQDVITDPKTAKSNRVIQMPAFLCEEMEDYIKSLYAVEPTDRIFAVTKSYLHREMDRGAKEAGVKRIRIHDLRHSHISLLIDMGFSALAIADRVGHESTDITYRYAHLFPTRQSPEEVEGAVEDAKAAFISYPRDMTDQIFSVYVNRPGVSFGYFFRGGGNLAGVNAGITEYTVEAYKERAFICMNQQQVERLKIDEGAIR